MSPPWPKTRCAMQFCPPSRHSDLTVNLASGYVNDPKTGYLLRSWVLVDAQNVKMTKKENEGHLISFETVCVTSDVNGDVQDANIMKYEFRRQR